MAKHEIFDESLLELGKAYSRKSLSLEQKLGSIEKTQSGVIQFSNCVLLLVTIGESKYRNRFEAQKFRMFFQNSRTKISTVVQRITNFDSTHLFSRKNERHKGPKEFIYIGEITPIEVFGEKPVEITWTVNSYSDIKDKSWFKDLAINQ
jgi:hypothetical protein